MTFRRGQGLGLLILLTSVLGAASCGVMWLTHPPGLPARMTDIVPAEGGPERPVEILVDERGIPHIFGDNDKDVAWGLGFFHARDRLFQILVLRHASQGRLTELFGEDLLATDLSYRLLTYRLDELDEKLGERDRSLMLAYLDGLNRGAAHAGASAEMSILGIEWEPMTVRDVLALVRLQSWGLSSDLRPELHKSRILGRLPEGDARREALLRAVPTGGVPITGDPRRPWREEGSERERDAGPAEPSRSDAGVRTLPLPQNDGDEGGGALVPLEPLPEATSLDAGTPQAALDLDAIRERALPWVEALGLHQQGASNSWAVSGKHTLSGAPMLSNDPHLRHLLPSIFYLAHLETHEMRAVGATFPGIPAVVIGHTRHLAWGMTTSYVDTQDLVLVDVDPADDSRYIVDGKPQRFGRWTQRFITDDDVVRTEVWRTTVFGPVLESAWGHLVEPGQVHALLWTGFDAELNRDNLSGFWDLYRAPDLPAARAAFERVGSASQNVTLAFTDGTIAYHLMGAVPRRQSGSPIDRPRPGRSSDAAWSGVLTSEEKPSLENPAAGYLVTANQRITDDSGPFEIGRGAVSPHRAQRIHQRLKPLIARGGIKLDEVLAIQGDVTSVEAQRLLPVLASHCPPKLSGYSEALVKRFCTTLKAWKGDYTTLSEGALLFNWLLEALQNEVVAAHLGTDVANQLRGDPATVMALEEALLGEAAGRLSPLLDDRRTPDREGLTGFMLRATASTLDRLGDDVGTDQEDWRWGRHHILQPKAALSRAPLIGGRFTLPWRPQPGHYRTIRAEGGTPVVSGSVLRFVAELKNPIEARFTLDFGQSGHMGHPHIDDMRDAWDSVKPKVIPVRKEVIEVESHVRILPSPAGAASTQAE